MSAAISSSIRREGRIASRISLPANRWVRGWRFVPGNATLVRRARVVLEPDHVLGVWLPDEDAVFLPEPAAWLLPRRATLRLEIEYAEPSATVYDRSQLTLYFTEQSASPLRHMKLGRGTTFLARGIRVMALTPSLAALGQSLRVVATRPDRIDRAASLGARLRSTIRPIVSPAAARTASRWLDDKVWSFDADASVDITCKSCSIADSQGDGATDTGTVNAASSTRPLRWNCIQRR